MKRKMHFQAFLPIPLLCCKTRGHTCQEDTILHALTLDERDLSMAFVSASLVLRAQARQQAES